MTTVGLVTSSKSRGLDREMPIFVRHCTSIGINHKVIEWDLGSDIQHVDMLLIRSAWDYCDHLEEFLIWLRQARLVGIPVVNDERLIRWNCHKRYLIELAAQGFPVVPTFIETTFDAASARFAEVGESVPEIVVKPAVGSGARRMSLVDRGDDESFRRGFALAHALWPEVIVQPFLPSVRVSGERAIVSIGGEVAAALQKRAAVGEWRVQREFGGEIALEPVRPLDGMLVETVRVYLRSHTGCEPTYCRLDLLEGSDGEPLISEVELIEPVLYSDLIPDVASRVIDACLSYPR